MDEPPASKMLDKQDPMDDKTYTMAHGTMIAATVPTHIAPAIEKKSNDGLHEREREKDEPSAQDEKSHGAPPPDRGRAAVNNRCNQSQT